MYLPGHLGTALLLYAPLLYVFLDRERPTLAAFGSVSILAFVMVPDIDLWVPFVRHRGPTHSLLFAVIVGVLVGGLGRVLDACRTEYAGAVFGWLGFTTSMLAVGSHLLADLITPRWQHAETLLSIEPLWPLVSWSFSLNLARAGDPALNIGTLCLGLAAVSLSWLWAKTPGPTSASVDALDPVES
jgi:inner membrane protein